MASQLAGDDIANVAAYFAAQTGASGTARSELLPNVAKTSVTFPDNYKSTFTKYHTINFPATRRVRYCYENDATLRAAKEGKPLPNGSILFAEVYPAKLDADRKPISGSDGFYVVDQLVAYTAMARDAGWGKDIPEMLRNDEWNYAVFTTEKKARPGGEPGGMPRLSQAARQGELHVHARAAYRRSEAEIARDRVTRGAGDDGGRVKRKGATADAAPSLAPRLRRPMMEWTEKGVRLRLAGQSCAIRVP